MGVELRRSCPHGPLESQHSLTDSDAERLGEAFTVTSAEDGDGDGDGPADFLVGAHTDSSEADEAGGCSGYGEPSAKRVSERRS